jgi:leucyl aminopeptidase
LVLSTSIEVKLTSTPYAEVETGLLFLPVFRDDEDTGYGGVSETLSGLVEAARSDGYSARRGSTFVLRVGLEAKLPVAADRVGLLGLGKREDWSDAAIRGCICRAAAAATRVGLSNVSVWLDSIGSSAPAELLSFASQGAVYGAYRFDRYRAADDARQKTALESVQLIGETVSGDSDSRWRGVVLGSAVCEARDWVNEPPSKCTPRFLAERAREIAESTGLELTLLEGLDALEANGMGLFHAVAKGSIEPPVLIHLVYRSDDAGDSPRRVALVGKGVTYDSGGYSMKSPASQIGMHGDMAGAAAVLGAAKSVGLLKPKGIEAHFIVPSAENLVSNCAYKVNDILTARNGKTVEVANTDAEGRLLLGDALAYAVDLDVDEIVDIATLTGGNVVTFGGVHAGVMTNDDALAKRFMSAAKRSGENFWRLPLSRRLAKQIKSNVADIKNSGGRWGSTITAALFLENFVGSKSWVHLDMAGLERRDDAWAHIPRGGTGFGVLALYEFLAS